MKIRRNRKTTLAFRLIVFLAGLGMLITGVANAMQGHSHYQTYWGAPVFYPYLIPIGLLTVALSFKRDNN